MRKIRFIGEVIENLLDDEKNAKHAEDEWDGHVHHGVFAKAFVYQLASLDETIVQLE